MEIIISALTALIALGLGLFFGFMALRNTAEQIKAWQMARSSQRWASAPGFIQTNQILYAGLRTARWQPQLTYTYQVNGKQYRGSRINFSFARVYFKKEAALALAPYPLHAKINVYYNPAQPQQCTLEQRQTGLLSGMLIGLVLLLPTSLCITTGIIGLAESLAR